MCDLVSCSPVTASTTPDASQVAQRVSNAIAMHAPFVGSFVRFSAMRALAVASLHLFRGRELPETPW
jgi:hypothetical protein